MEDRTTFADGVRHIPVPRKGQTPLCQCATRAPPHRKRFFMLESPNSQVSRRVARLRETEVGVEWGREDQLSSSAATVGNSNSSSCLKAQGRMCTLGGVLRAESLTLMGTTPSSMRDCPSPLHSLLVPFDNLVPSPASSPKRLSVLRAQFFFRDTRLTAQTPSSLPNSRRTGRRT